MEDRLANIDDIYLAALERENPAERTAYLDDACAGNSELRRRVERLLEVQAKIGSFLEEPAPEICATINQPPCELAGTQIGPYKLLEQIGEGGMGTVWMAQQTEPVKRVVAVKLIKAGMDSRQVVARFEAERQALALMDHPNIAKVLDGGTTGGVRGRDSGVREGRREDSTSLAPDPWPPTAAGRPYFVMDLVKGLPITRYCDEHHLTPRQRLELFIPVCQAIQHAHQKGIIHRDLKPSNVLVALYDGRPVPKVIDFGVAKAAGQTLTDKTLVTGFGAIVGTLEYMSPEQAEINQLDIDTRSDIYSLGVLLYELLTGETPFDKHRLRAAAFGEMLRIIREEEPPKPSTRLSDLSRSGEPSRTNGGAGAARLAAPTCSRASIAANRSMEPAKLSGLVRGELDWIVMKALEKDRNRRYESANGFAMDIQRYLSEEHVLACPPSATYRFRKFARRNRAALGTAAVVALALVLGTVVSTWQAIRAQIARTEEAKQRAIADQRRIEAEKQRGEADRQSRIAKEETGRARQAVRTGGRYLYAAHMKLAEEAWQRGQVAQVLELLNGQRPQASQEDLRSFEWYYLWGLCHRRDTLTLRPEHGPVLAVAFSPDGRTFATGADDGTVGLWDPVTGQQRASLQAHTHGVCALAFFPGGETLASGSANGTVKLWDVITKDCLAVLEGHTEPVFSIALSPDARNLATASADHTAKLWDTETKTRRLSLEISHSQWSYGVRSVIFTPDGSTLATAGGAVFGEGQVHLWDAVTGKERAALKGLKDPVLSVAVSPNGKLLATGGYDTTVRLWELATLEQKAVLRGHRAAVTALSFASDSGSLASASADATVKLWSVYTQQAETTLKAHLDSISSVAFAPGGKIVATGSADGTAKLWDPAPRHEWSSFVAHSGEVRSLAFSPDGRLLVTTSFQDEKVKLWDVATGREQKTHRGNQGFHAVAFPPDGKAFAAAGNETVELWDLITDRKRTIPTAHQGGPWTVAFSPDGGLMATGGDDQMARVWDCITGQEQAVLKGHRGKVQQVLFSPDGMTLATASWDHTVKLWDRSTWRERATLRGHSHAVTSLAFAPDSTTLASGGTDKVARLWDITTGRERITLSGHTGPIWSVAFTTDGRTLATGAWDGTVKLWDPVTGQERLMLQADAQPIWCIAFSPDGRSLAAAGRHGIVNLWRAAGANETHKASLRGQPLPGRGGGSVGKSLEAFNN